MNTLQRFSNILIIISILLPAINAAERPPESPITFTSLLQEMIDREHYARLPDPAYTCGQFSSYERTSVAPHQSGWFANHDWSHFLRAEQRDGRTEWVMMDTPGPGAIARIWVGGMVPEGMIRFYLDHSDTPAIEGFVYDIIGGTALTSPPFSAVRARGGNLYLPIPYAQHCKITFDGPNFWQTGKRNQRFWYIINHRTYPKNTPAQTFSPQLLKTHQSQLQTVGEVLLHPDRTTKTEMNTDSLNGKLNPNQSLRKTFNGPGAIYRIKVKITADDFTQALRSTVLTFSFDNKQTVWCPLGDFFGSGFGLNPYQGWYRIVEKDGTLYCYWVMPFEKTCQLALTNYGKQPVTISSGSVQHQPWKWHKNSLYFHTTWRQQRNIKITGRQGQDFNFVTIRGRGVFMGDTLTLHNGAKTWWGEGDEKIYIDNEVFPSHFGTGSEDYYGYSYGNNAIFQAPFHAQPRGIGNNTIDYTTNTRTRALDAIPFQIALNHNLEIWHWGTTQMTYAVTTYWYATTETTCNIAPDIAAAAALINPKVK